MSRIRWEEDFGEWPDEHQWIGYLGKVPICAVDWCFEMAFHPFEELVSYTKLSSAKRGAERLLDKFLRDAGLEVKDG